MEKYEDCDEFDEIHSFYSYVTQIFCNYIESYIDGKKISLEKIKTILDCIVYNYAFCGGGDIGRINYLSLEKCIVEDDEDNYEFLDIPIPITKTDEWYANLISINN